MITLLVNITARDNALCPIIHKRYHATLLAKIGSVKNDIVNTCVINFFKRKNREPKANDSPQCVCAVTRQFTKLSDRITFKNPQMKPTLSPRTPDIWPFPKIGPFTILASVTLFALGISSISLCRLGTTIRTSLFYSWKPPLLNYRNHLIIYEKP